ncbi:aromatic ring-hydroxylating oxygenase subunit alpha [Novosphingobium malaysiense]|nr:aromatic ring-hydroxylating dioxygenase subunit alpha [Novosphingobium malaysiense]
MTTNYQQLLDSDSRPVPPVLREQSRPEFDTAPLDAARYTSQAFFDAEDREMWSRVWQMACRLEDIPEIGDVEVYDIVDRSALIVRSGTEEVRAYHNVCLHRGRKLLTQAGRVESIRCGFHGWSWNLDGNLNSLPCRSEFAHLADDDLSLVPVRAETWGGFVFVNFDPEAEPLVDYLGVLPEHFVRWQPEHCYKAAHVARVIPCNWKVAQEAFMESYHVVATHPQILPFFDDVGSQYDVYGKHVNRNLAAFGAASPHMGEGHGARAVVDGMLEMWGRTPDAVPSGREDAGARAVLGNISRRALGRKVAGGLDDATDAEMLDALVYNVFPNFAPWGGFAPNIVYRWRPNGRDVDSCIMEVMMLKRLPADGGRPEAAKVHWLGEDEPWSAAQELPILGPVIDQDMENMPLVQRGLKASPTGKVHLASYAESRIRHFHQTLDRYLSGNRRE